MTDEPGMRPACDPDPEERPVSFVGRPVPRGMAVRLVAIRAHTELAYEPSEWAGALVVVEAGEIELECFSGASALFGPGSVLFFDGLGLRTIRNLGSETVCLSAASRQGAHQPAKERSVKRMVVQYKVKPEHAERNAELIRAVYEEIECAQPDGLRYGALRLADGVTFIHIAEEPADGQSRLGTLESFRRFRAGIAERCEVPPSAQESSEVGSFRLFASSSLAEETQL